MNKSPVLLISLIAFVALFVWAISEPKSQPAVAQQCTTHCVDHGVVTSSY